jgi:ribosomal protein S18 acetylase RimI-like enzyme
MKLETPITEHYSELLSWVTSAEQLADWAGPNMSYPCDTQRLTSDLQSSNWPSFSLVSHDHKLLAFGQYYLRQGRCHLCRLIVSPEHRGKGIIKQLIDLISIQGCQQLEVNTQSLFVYTYNTSAIKAYQKLGFVTKQYYATDAMQNCLYMTKRLDLTKSEING